MTDRSYCSTSTDFKEITWPNIYKSHKDELTVDCMLSINMLESGYGEGDRVTFLECSVPMRSYRGWQRGGRS